MRGVASVCSLVVIAGLAAPAWAEVSSSSNFSLESLEAVAGVGGGSSANFESDVAFATTPVGSASSANYSVEPSPVPEPSRAAQLLWGVSAVALLRTRRRAAM